MDQTFFTDATLIKSADFGSGGMVTNGFFYCLEPEQQYLNGLQFFVQSRDQITKLTQVGNNLDEHCKGLDINDNHRFEHIIVYFNDEIVTGVKIAIPGKTRVFGITGGDLNSLKFTFTEDKPLIGMYGW